MPNRFGPRRALLGGRIASVLSVLQNIAGYLVSWPLQETTGAVSLADNIAVTIPDTRNVATLTYAAYVAGANWANSSAQIARHTAGSVATIQQNDIIAAGSTWEYPIVISNRTAGSVSVTGGDIPASINGTTVVAITAIGDDVIITPTTDFDGDIDLAQGIVRQTNILASSVFSDPPPVYDAGANEFTVSNVNVITTIDPTGCYFGDGYTNIYSAALNTWWGAANEDGMIVRASFSDTYSGAPAAGFLGVDADNLLMVKRTGGATVRVRQNSNATNKQKDLTLSDTALHTYAFSNSLTNDTFRGWVDGAEDGAALTGLGTFAGNLNSNNCLVGAEGIAGLTNPMFGTVSDEILFKSFNGAYASINTTMGAIHTALAAGTLTTAALDGYFGANNWAWIQYNYNNPLDGTDTGTTPGVTMGRNVGKTDDGATSKTVLGLTEYNSMINPVLFHIGLGVQKAVWDASERYFLSLIIDASNWIKIGGTAVAGQLVYEIRAGGVTEQVLHASGSPTGIIMPSISSKAGTMKAWLGSTQVGGDVAIANTLTGNFATMIIGAEDDTPTNVDLANRNYYWHFSDEKTSGELATIASAIGASQ